MCVFKDVYIIACMDACMDAIVCVCVFNIDLYVCLFTYPYHLYVCIQASTSVLMTLTKQTAKCPRGIQQLCLNIFNMQNILSMQGLKGEEELTYIRSSTNLFSLDPVFF